MKNYREIRPGVLEEITQPSPVLVDVERLRQIVFNIVPEAAPAPVEEAAPAEVETTSQDDTPSSASGA